LTRFFLFNFSSIFSVLSFIKLIRLLNRAIYSIAAHSVIRGRRQPTDCHSVLRYRNSLWLEPFQQCCVGTDIVRNSDGICKYHRHLQFEIPFTYALITYQCMIGYNACTEILVQFLRKCCLQIYSFHAISKYKCWHFFLPCTSFAMFLRAKCSVIFLSLMLQCTYSIHPHNYANLFSINHMEHIFCMYKVNSHS
jgi:hypothetical protein